MALYPHGEKLDEFTSRFTLVNLAARRATQLSRDKAPVLVETRSQHPLTIALEEIAMGAVVPVFETPSELGEGKDTLDSLQLGAAEKASIHDLFSGTERGSVVSESALADLVALDSLVDESTSELEEIEEEFNLEDFGGTMATDEDASGMSVQEIEE